MNEKQIENSILDYLKLKGIFCFKVNTTGVYDASRKKFRLSHSKHQIKGVSDIIGILPNGTFLAIEVKLDKTPFSEKTYPSKEQKLFIENITNNKGIAFVARSIQDVERVLVGILGERFRINSFTSNQNH